MENHTFAFRSGVNFTKTMVNAPEKRFSTAGTWIIRETKNWSEITKKRNIYQQKDIRKIIYRDSWPQNNWLSGPGHEKVENHCTRKQHFSGAKLHQLKHNFYTRINWIVSKLFVFNWCQSYLLMLVNITFGDNMSASMG